MECSLQNEFFYLTQGDMLIARKYHIGQEFYFPTKHYQGVTISIAADAPPDCLSALLMDVHMTMNDFAEKYCAAKHCFAARTTAQIERVFLELYQVPEQIQKGYLKEKIMELFLLLSAAPPQNCWAKPRYYTPLQVNAAKQVCQYLKDHMDSHITIDELSEMLHVSSTQLKTSFQGVYGTSIYAYARSLKMHSAADLLRTTSKTVLEVAGIYGYSNGSKFSQAFCSVMGMTPNAYRKKGLNGVE